VHIHWYIVNILPSYRYHPTKLHAYISQRTVVLIGKWKFSISLFIEDIILEQVVTGLLYQQDNDTYSFTIYGHPGIRSDWNDVILSPIPSGKPTQKMTYLIRGLEPSSQYEARVEAKNRFGWSRSSDSFTFSTTGMGKSKCSAGSLQLVSYLQLMSLHALRMC
jgi:hypothetical protein